MSVCVKCLVKFALPLKRLANFDVRFKIRLGIGPGFQHVFVRVQCLVIPPQLEQIIAHALPRLGAQFVLFAERVEQGMIGLDGVFPVVLGRLHFRQGQICQGVQLGIGFWVEQRKRVPGVWDAVHGPQGKPLPIARL